MSDENIYVNVTLNQTTSGLNQTASGGLSPSEWIILKTFAVTMMVAFPIGLIFNILSLLTLCKVPAKTATENIFIGLTFADTLSNLSGVITNLIITLSYFTSFGKNPFVVQNFKYFLRTDVVLYFLSFTITSTLSIERLFAVFKSSSFRKIWTPVCGIITLLTGCGSTLLVCILIVTLISENALLLFRIVFSIICVFVVLVANIVTLYGLKTKLSMIAPVNSTSQSLNAARERRQTNILIIVSVIFIISASTNATTALVGMLDTQDFQISGFTTFVYGYVRWVFQVVYSTLNSVIFVVYNKNYRQAFIDTILCQKT